MFKKKFIIVFSIVILLFMNMYFALATEVNNNVNEVNGKVEAIQVPEDNINLKIENLTRGSKVYLLLSENLIRYNMERFISNNLNNPYTMEAQKAQKIQDFMNKQDYIGYVEYYKELGFTQESENQIELRHYCFAMGNSEIVGEHSYNNTKYAQILINLSEEDSFKVILKDYLVNYDSLDIKFMIDEYGSLTYIDLNNVGYVQNPEKANIRECNITYKYVSDEEFSSIENSTNIVYWILYIILAIILITIIVLLIKRYKAKKQEIEDRKFWKKKLTKEEKKEEKRKQREQKKLEKKNRKK